MIAVRLKHAALVVAASIYASSPTSAETVTTLSGSGTTGILDGTASTASFMAPFGIAFDRAGNAYISDAAAQRIRVLHRDGSVTTLAGGGDPIAIGTWVPGGYADGRGAAARFNRPNGIAVAPDGAVFVADSMNNTIRKIASDGTVSSFVGGPDKAGVVAGSRTSAQIAGVGALAIDRGSNLYVTTATGAIMRIDENGSASISYQIPVAQWSQFPQWSIAVADRPDGTVVFVSDGTGITVVAPDGKVKYFRNDASALRCAQEKATGASCARVASPVVGLRDVGAPAGIAALSPSVVIYTEGRSNTIRTLDVETGTVRFVAGIPNNDGSAYTAGYADGDGADARLNAPTGIAMAPDGRAVFLDAGNRRVRAVERIDRHGPIDGAQFATFRPNPQRATVAYAGDASIWPGVPWARTLEGQLERSLSGRGTQFDVVPVVLTDETLARRDLRALADNLHNVTAVVLEITARDISHIGLESFVTELKRISAARRRAATRFVVVVLPDAADVSPNEAMWERGTIGPPALAGTPNATAIAMALNAAGIRSIDMSPAFVALAASGHGPIFSARSRELGPAGRTATAAAVAAALGVAE